MTLKLSQWKMTVVAYPNFVMSYPYFFICNSNKEFIQLLAVLNWQHLVNLRISFTAIHLIIYTKVQSDNI